MIVMSSKGFSFADDEAGFARNQEDVARDLYSALTQFFTAFEMFQDNDFYVTGESYAGQLMSQGSGNYLIVGASVGQKGGKWHLNNVKNFPEPHAESHGSYLWVVGL